MRSPRQQSSDTPPVSAKWLPYAGTRTRKLGIAWKARSSQPPRQAVIKEATGLLAIGSETTHHGRLVTQVYFRAKKIPGTCGCLVGSGSRVHLEGIANWLKMRKLQTAEVL
jgi:hypothetical protein